MWSHNYLIMRDGAKYELGDGFLEIECFRCGVCCIRYRPKVTLKEITRIARKLHMSKEAFQATYVREVPTTDAYILQSSADTCPFLRQNEKCAEATCSIHAIRPEACRNWAPSLSRRECREGLAKLKAGGGLLLPRDMYKYSRNREKLSAVVMKSKCEMVDNSP